VHQAQLEIGRIGAGGRTVVEGLEALVGLRACDRPSRQAVARALDQTWTRDPLDRLIAGQAAVADALLVTKDRTVRDHYPMAFWSEV